MTGRILKMLNHHYRIEIALIKTKLRTKLSSNNQQTANSNKKTEKPEPQKEPKGRNEKLTSQ